MSIIVSFGRKYAGFFTDLGLAPEQRRYVFGWFSVIIVDFDIDEAIANNTLVIKDVEKV